MRKHWGIFLTLIAVALLAGCGGGSSSSPTTNNSTNSSTDSVSGVVADGYLVGATVCSDQDLDKTCDNETEASGLKTTTKAGGSYTLSGPNLGEYPIVVEVKAGVTTDSDYPSTPIANSYVLSAPAEAPEFVSPLTTLVQQQLEQSGGTKTLDQVVAELQQTLKVTADLVGPDADFMKKADDDELTKLHHVAQVVASSMGEMQEKIAGFADQETPLEEIVALVVQEVMEQLEDIADAVADAVADAEVGTGTFDPTNISGTVVSKMTVTEDNIEEKLQAAAPAELTAFQTLMADGGVYWLDPYGSYESGSYVNQQLEYGCVTADTDGQLGEDYYQWDSSESAWVESLDKDNEYYLISGQWVAVEDGPNQSTIAYNDDQSATITNTITGIQEKIRVAAVDIAGDKISAWAPGIALLDNSLTFPEGAEIYRMTFEYLTDSYEVWDDDALHYWTATSKVVFTTLDDVKTHYAADSDNYFWLEDVAIQFADAGVLNFFNWDASVGSYVAVGHGSYETVDVQGQSLLMLNIGEQVENPFLVAWDDDTIRQGNYTKAGTIGADTDIFSGNKIAFEALDANLNQTGVYPTWFTVSARNYEDASKNKTQLLIGYQPNDTNGSTPLAIASVDFPKNGSTTETILRTTQYNDTYYFFDCTGDSCLNRGMFSDTYLAAPGAAEEYNALEYVIKTHTTAGDTLLTYVDYPGHIDLPYISSESIEITDTDDGMTISWSLPTDAANWDQVDQILLNFDNGEGGAVHLKLNADATSFNVPAELADMLGSAATVTLQTRAYEGKLNYARGISNTVPVFETTPITEFTEDFLSGRTLYNVFDDGGSWAGVTDVFSADGTFTGHENLTGTVTDDVTGTWSVDNGVITLSTVEFGDSYIKIISSSSDRLDICWSDTMNNLDACTVAQEYFYFGAAAAQAAVATFNAE